MDILCQCTFLSWPKNSFLQVRTGTIVRSCHICFAYDRKKLINFLNIYFQRRATLLQVSSRLVPIIWYSPLSLHQHTKKQTNKNTSVWNHPHIEVSVGAWSAVAQRVALCTLWRHRESAYTHSTAAAQKSEGVLPHKCTRGCPLAKTSGRTAGRHRKRVCSAGRSRTNAKFSSRIVCAVSHSSLAKLAC